MRMKNFIGKIKTFTLVLLISSTFTEQAFAVPAFPGAEGPGAETVGGRGGQIIEVTNLNDSGDGSLRAAIEASGSRTVVFKVAGIIDLDSVIYIKNPYLTIAGQTAPEGGITLKSWGIQIRTHDVIMRYIKSRPGIDRDDYNTDGLGMQGADDLYRNILDHCSLSWANDENAQIWSKSEIIAPHHITYSWNILSEGFSGHSCGFLLGASNDSADEMKDISIHHNLFASNHHRNPMMKIKEVKFINNLVYNWDYYASATTGGVRLDIIGNKYKMGPTTPSYRYHELIVKTQAEVADGSTSVEGDPEIYIKGNVSPRLSDETADNWSMTSTYYDRDPLDRKYERGTPLTKATFPIVIDSVTKAEQEILADSGASKRINERGEWVANRDTVDQRIINDYKNGTGTIPASENDVGGYPKINPGTPYADSDHDGMSDVWEDIYGLDKHNYDDNTKDKDGDGYTNIEEFINGTNPNSIDSGVGVTVLENKDTDGEGINNNVDKDDDNDGISDIDELANGLNPLDSSDAEADFDKDGFSNIFELSMGTDIHNASSRPQFVLIPMGDGLMMPLTYLQ